MSSIHFKILSYSLSTETLSSECKQLSDEKLKTQQLISSILPRFLITKIQGTKKTGDKAKQKPIFETLIDSVSVYCAFYRDSHSERKEINPQRLMKEEEVAENFIYCIHRIFSRIDDLIDETDCIKVKTVWNNYIFLKKNTVKSMKENDDSFFLQNEEYKYTKKIIRESVDVAFRILEIAKQEKFCCKIGISFGNIAVGCIGRKKSFEWDAISKTINLSQRFAVTSEKNKIQTNYEFVDLLENSIDEKFVFSRRGTTFIKGQGEITTYYISKKSKSNFNSFRSISSTDSISSDDWD